LTQENEPKKYNPRDHALGTTIALSLLLKEFGLTTKDDRYYVHNILLLAACEGLTSYSFGWYGNKQLSTELEKDLAEVDYLDYVGGTGDLQLKKYIRDKIANLNSSLNPPEDLDKKSWVNLLTVVLWGLWHNETHQQQTMLPILIQPYVRDKQALKYLDSALELIKKHDLSYDRI
jgi:hypothetical protein